MEGRPVETRLNLEDMGEKEEYPLWSLGGFPQERGAAGEHTEVEMEVEGQAEDAGSVHSDTRPLVQDRDPKGVNKCLKVTDVPSFENRFLNVFLYSILCIFESMEC